MRLASLRVQNVRTHEECSLDIAPNVTLVTGRNGSGKTSLLEAIYISLQGISFRGSDNEILRQGAPWYRIDSEIENGGVRTVKFDPSRSAGKKQFEVDGKTSYRLTYANKYPVVLFEPEDMRLVHGSPERRRRFLDRFIAQFDPEYALSLRRYERALRQRNILLKSHSSSDDLFVWDVSLSKYGAYIINRRLEVVSKIQPNLESVYKDIAQSDDAVKIEYTADYKDSIEQRLLSDLHYSASRDKALGYTSVGPHRHDLLFELNSSPAASIASRGEVRTMVLAIKFIEVDILKGSTDKDPIILLDDVFSELDEPRQKAMMERFSKYQTIITSVSAPAGDYPTTELSG